MARTPIQRQSTARNLPVSSQLIPPVRIRQHNGAAARGVARFEDAPVLRRDAQHRKELRAHRHRQRALPLALPLHRRAARSPGERRQLRETLAPPLPLFQLAIGIEPFARRAMLRRALPHHRQPPRIAIRQRPQNHCLHNREHRRIEPDTRGQNAHHYRREHRPAQQHAHGKAHILCHRLRPTPTPRLHTSLLHARSVAKLPPRRAGRGLSRNTILLQRLRRTLHMERHLFVQFARQPLPPKQHPYAPVELTPSHRGHPDPHGIKP
ncbi:MAG TPA: hypothetical protein VE218_06625 [Acidobacteriaceae bacterium]|nr:hypothetical protein [Acidobacteriaceae bacterium]